MECYISQQTKYYLLDFMQVDWYYDLYLTRNADFAYFLKQMTKSSHFSHSGSLLPLQLPASAFMPFLTHGHGYYLWFGDSFETQLLTLGFPFAVLYRS